MKCPYCGHENDEQAKTCGKCYAGIPHEEKKLAEDTKENSENGRRSTRKKE